MDSLIRINVKTSKSREVIDITDQTNGLLRDQNIKAGFCFLFIKGINIALTTTSLDPEKDLSVASVFEITIPELTTPEASESYNRRITPVSESVIASFLGPSLSLPFENNQLLLGENQRVFLVELAGPREHEIVVEFK